MATYHRPVLAAKMTKKISAKSNGKKNVGSSPEEKHLENPMLPLQPVGT